MKTQQSLEQQPHQGPRDFRSRLASRGGVRKEKPLTGDLGNSQSCPVPSGTQPGNVSSPPSCQGSRPRKQRSPKEPLDTDKNLRTKKRALIGLFPGVGGRAETTFQALTPSSADVRDTTCDSTHDLRKVRQPHQGSERGRSGEAGEEPRPPSSAPPPSGAEPGLRLLSRAVEGRGVFQTRH